MAAAISTLNCNAISSATKRRAIRRCCRSPATLHLPVIATNGVRAATEADRQILDVLTAIRHHAPLNCAGRLLTLNAARSLRSAREMSALFSDLPEAIANTGIVSERLNFTLDKLGYEFPHYPVPDGEPWTAFLLSASMKAFASVMRFL